MSHRNIPKYVENFFQSCEIDEKLNRYGFFLIRYDGVVLYHNNNLANQATKTSIGVLLGGIWQAAKALADFIPREEWHEGYRLSFDTASKGVYIVPIDVEGEELYLGLIYHQEVNPGFIKNKIRELAVAFGEYLAIELKDNKKKESKSDFLFGEISDSEMDRLFSFVKN